MIDRYGIISKTKNAIKSVIQDNKLKYMLLLLVGLDLLSESKCEAWFFDSLCKILFLNGKIADIKYVTGNKAFH